MRSRTAATPSESVRATHRTTTTCSESRLEETLRIIHGLLRQGQIDFEGIFQSASAERFLPTGPRPTTIPINVAAGGLRMLSLTAELGDEWNWWAGANPEIENLVEITAELSEACRALKRDPDTLTRTFDLYSFDPLRVVGETPPHAMSASPDRIATTLLRLGEIGSMRFGSMSP